MLNRSNTDNKQANQRQGLVPLTPEVAREIEKLLIKNAGALEELKARRNFDAIQQESSPAQFSSS